MRFVNVPASLLAGCFLGMAAHSLPQVAQQASPAITRSEIKTCASCHAEIAKTYADTAMAAASGPAAQQLASGEFDHKPSDVHYRVYEQDGKAWMSFERKGKDAIRGQRELLYFMGAGKKERAFLFSDQGFLFVAPITWFADKQHWDSARTSAAAQQIPMNLPANVGCLNCHASGTQASAPGTENKFAGKPFLHSGITCERCHGSGQEHADGKGPIVNPAKLPPDRRDSICLECHFDRTVAVEQPDKHLYQFQPGEKISDYVHYFLLAGNRERTSRALTQFEALSLSACKRRSGDQMWCGSCHDPHQEPAPTEKSAYYRAKCLACHGDAFAAKHHPDKADCRECHMPALTSKDEIHAESTDHRILRYSSTAPIPQLQLRGRPLVSFPEGDTALATDRDYALGWEGLAQLNVEGAPQLAEEFLRKAVNERPDDAVLLSALGLVEQQHGHATEARGFYERALKIDPLVNDAATNLGILEARAGHLRRAVELWQGVFERMPYRSAVGTNLALAFCAAGQKQAAQHYVERVLESNPDYGKAKTLRQHLNLDPPQCRP